MVKDFETQSNQVFNMSVATLERINNDLVSLKEAFNNMNIYFMQKYLFALYKELNPYLKEGERDFGDDIYSQIDNGIVFENNKMMVEINLYSIMDNYDFWIRKKLHEKGLLMAKPDNPEIALGQF